VPAASKPDPADRVRPGPGDLRAAALLAWVVGVLLCYGLVVLREKAPILIERMAAAAGLPPR
jgi:hypothetical protein